MDIMKFMMDIEWLMIVMDDPDAYFSCVINGGDLEFFIVGFTDHWTSPRRCSWAGQDEGRSSEECERQLYLVEVKCRSDPVPQGRLAVF